LITPGINPYIDSPEHIASMLQEQLVWDNDVYKAKKLYYFGSGASQKANQELLASIFKKHFGIERVEVKGDLLAAAYALCGTEKGMVCILGTGSSSCYYNGKTVKETQPSLGYIAGDEGSGNYMGKRILQYYTYKTFDEELRLGFEMRFGDDIRKIINKLYHESYPNRYLATFVSLLAENRGHYMVENIIEDCLGDFFQVNLLKYRQSWNMPINFTGSVAYHFRDVIEGLCSQYELELGKIEKSPMNGLVNYLVQHEG
jgi:N-acetylglucosamine kinase-like BadF-type ATPase